MKLNAEEEKWLRGFCEEVGRRFPGAVDQLVIYGSKARGEDHWDSDLDVLLVVKNESAGQKREIRRAGYALAAASTVVPSILAYSVREWDLRGRTNSPFRRAVERDGVRVL